MSDLTTGFEWESGMVVTPTRLNSMMADAVIDALAVTTGKIADLAVTTGKIADLAVTTDKIAAGAVTAAKLAGTAITAAALNQGIVQAVLYSGPASNQSSAAAHTAIDVTMTKTNAANHQVMVVWINTSATNSLSSVELGLGNSGGGTSAFLKSDLGANTLARGLIYTDFSGAGGGMAKVILNYSPNASLEANRVKALVLEIKA